MMVVNGREYPLWSQFVKKKKEWIGGRLQDEGDSMDRRISGREVFETKIIDITLKPNGDSSAFFSIEGEKFSCGFDVSAGGITAGDESWLTFAGYGSHIWRIKKPEKNKVKEVFCGKNRDCR